MPRPVDEDSRGILRPRPGLERFRLARRAPSAPVDRFVDRYWIAEWDLDEPYTQEVLAHPVVNVVFEAVGATVHGVSRTRARKELSGSGRAIGVMFRPAGFRPFVELPMSALSERSVPLRELFPGTAALERRVAAAPTDEAVDLVERWLLPVVPADRVASEDVTDVVESVAADRTIGRVDELARRAGTSVRHLQRLFAEHVGASPKSVIRRYRLYDAAEATAHGDDVDWAALATRLGYSDQSHLVRDFTAAMGVSPARYAAQNRRTPFPSETSFGDGRPTRTS